MRRHAWTIAFLTLLAPACADLEPIAAGECGNSVVEPANAEDCDGPDDSGHVCRDPGDEGECRWDCSAAGDCPPGFDCGSAGICHQPSGRFEVRSGFAIDAASRLIVTDLDGDGPADVVTNRNGVIQVHYTDSARGVATSVVAPLFGKHVIAEDLTGDGLKDLAAIGDGLMIAKSSPGGSLQPIVYAQIELPDDRPIMLLDALPERFTVSYGGAKVTSELSGDEVLSCYDTGIYFHGKNLEPTLIATLPDGKTHRDFKAQPLAAQLHTASPCEELVVWFADSTKVWIYRPCRAVDDGWDWSTSAEQPPPVALPDSVPGSTVVSNVLIADVNGDGLSDLLIDTNLPLTDSCKSPIFVALGTGNGTFYSGINPNVAACIDNPTLVNKHPIAAGDLNADGQLDFVTRDQVLLSADIGWNPDAPPPFDITTVAYFSLDYPGADWNFAHIADFNDNGALDVVAMSRQRASLDFLNGSAQNAFAEASIPLSSSPEMAQIGDFDGDLIPDVAFKLRGPHGDVGQGIEVGDSVVVSFSTPQGLPSAPVAMGRLGKIAQIAAGRIDEVHVDAVDDLIVVTQPEDESAREAAILIGTSQRLMLAPFFFADEDDPLLSKTTLPVGLAAGQFDGDEAGHPDLAVVTTDVLLSDSGAAGWGDLGESHLWVVPLSGEAAFSAADVLPTDDALGATLGAERLIMAAPLVTAVNLDGNPGDSPDELVVLTMHALSLDLANLDGAVLTSGMAADKWGPPAIQLTTELYQENPDASGAGEVNTHDTAGQGDGGPSGYGGGDQPAEEVAGEYIIYDGQIQKADIDGDGVEEVIALAVSIAKDGDVWVYWTNIVVFRSPGDGTLDVPNRLVLTDPMMQNPTSFVAVNADDDPASELVVLTMSGAYVADLDLSTGQLAGARWLEHVPGGHFIAAGDLDDDGVPDLTISTPERVIFAYGIPRLPLD